MRKSGVFATIQILLSTFSGMPSFAGGGLQLLVLDKNSKGIESEIYAKMNAIELKIGTTDHYGKYTDSSYQCSNDRNLVAKPIDKSYFDSPPQPCRSPQKLLVISRLTPKGNLAFGGFSKSFMTKSGDIGQVNYRATIETTQFNSIASALAGRKPDPEMHKEKWAEVKCAFDYRIDVNKTKFVLRGENWEQVSESNEPASTVLPLTNNDIKRYSIGKEEWLRKDDSIVKTENGFVLATSAPCEEARETAKNLRDSLERAYSDKINSGGYDQMKVDYFIKQDEK